MYDGYAAEQAPQALSLVLAFLPTLLVFLVLVPLLVVTLVAWWRIFTKAGEGGWKILIPYYGNYTQYKVAGSVPLFWVFIGITALSWIDFSVLAAAGNSRNTGLAVFGFILMILLLIADIVLMIVFSVRLARAFGQGGGFAAGLFFLPFIFWCILGFGPARYVGSGLAAPDAQGAGEP